MADDPSADLGAGGQDIPPTQDGADPVPGTDDGAVAAVADPAGADAADTTDTAATLDAAEAVLDSAGDAVGLPDFGAVVPEGGLNHGIDLLHDVDLRVKIELGRTRMLVEDVLKLGEGSVVELNKLAGDPVDVFANDRLIARGEVLVLNDSFCVRVSEIFSGQTSDA